MIAQLAKEPEALEVQMGRSSSKLNILVNSGVVIEQSLPEDIVTNEDFNNKMVNALLDKSSLNSFICFNYNDSVSRWYNLSNIEAIEFIEDPSLHDKGGSNND